MIFILHRYLARGAFSNHYCQRHFSDTLENVAYLCQQSFCLQEKSIKSLSLAPTETPKGRSLEPDILNAWSPGAQAVPMVIFLNFERWSPWSPEKEAMEPWSRAIFPLGARSPLKCALETPSPRFLRRPPNQQGSLRWRHNSVQ